MGGALDECSADRIGGLRALVDDFTINMMALPVAHLAPANAPVGPMQRRIIGYDRTWNWSDGSVNKRRRQCGTTIGGIQLHWSGAVIFTLPTRPMSHQCDKCDNVMFGNVRMTEGLLEHRQLQRPAVDALSRHWCLALGSLRRSVWPIS